MRMLNKIFAIAGASLLAAQGAAHEKEAETHAVGALDFGGASPVYALENAQLSRRTFGFGTSHQIKKLKPVWISSFGLYDKVVGVACTWTLSGETVGGKDSYKAAKIVSQRCAVASVEPEMWKRTIGDDFTKEGAGNYTNVANLTGDAKQLLEFSENALPVRELRSFQFRTWNNDKKEICLRSALRDLNDEKAPWIVNIDHGCFKFSQTDYMSRKHKAFQANYEG
ncbi:MAG: hypothetical protein DI551_08665 [Micavibrio aeruginosavorus]|uniref:Uncharacterized protein n=1 Tax=Micavibrio aeruginosavorus TaxID=349221 RepID=A0A2W5PKC2_9BACT|nr:MAG: hypothetical protein DI551_08665 [Micavibrio aeruginosavorus]